MDEERLSWIPRPRMPALQIRRSGMRRKAVDRMDLRFHRNTVAKQLHGFRPIDDDPRKRSFRSVADKDHAAISMGEIVTQVMANPSTSTHARPSHYDRTRANTI